MLLLIEYRGWSVQAPVDRAREGGYSICPDLRDLHPEPDAQPGGDVVLMCEDTRAWCLKKTRFDIIIRPMCTVPVKNGLKTRAPGWF